MQMRLTYLDQTFVEKRFFIGMNLMEAARQLSICIKEEISNDANISYEKIKGATLFRLSYRDGEEILDGTTEYDVDLTVHFEGKEYVFYIGLIFSPYYLKSLKEKSFYSLFYEIAEMMHREYQLINILNVKKSK